MHPEDRVLVAVLNSPRDFERVSDEGWYRIPVKHAPASNLIESRMTMSRMHAGS